MTPTTEELMALVRGSAPRVAALDRVLRNVFRPPTEAERARLVERNRASLAPRAAESKGDE